jgi:DNA-binding NtrC family response regulator
LSAILTGSPVNPESAGCPAIVPPKEKAMEKAVRENIKVLVVDDEVGPRESLKMILKPFYHVYTADNGTDALSLMRVHKMDLVTLDLKMPGLHGTEVLQAIKRDHQDTEVVIVTGFGGLKTAVDGIRFGASDYLLKPFNITEMLTTIRRVLDRRPSVQTQPQTGTA